MRVTDKMAYNQVIGNLQKNRADQSDLQNQAATQKRINKPSDDPVASARVLGQRTEQRGSEQYMKNINIARSFLEFSDQSLAELSETLVRAKELAIQQANDAGASEETRRVVSQEVGQIYSQAIQIGNRKLGERYIFSGYQTTKSPFNINGTYNGDSGDMKVQINKDAFLSMNISGDKVFLGEGIGADGIIRETSTTPKTADEVRQLQENEQLIKEQKENGEEQEFTLRAPASKATRQRVVQSQVSQEQSGTNVLKILKDFEIALKVDDKEEIQFAIDSLDSALSQVVNARAQVGSRIATLNHTTESLQKAIVENKGVASQLEDADVFNTMSEINKNDSTLQASMETSSRLIGKNLMDFLK